MSNITELRPYYIHPYPANGTHDFSARTCQTVLLLVRFLEVSCPWSLVGVMLTTQQPMTTLQILSLELIYLSYSVREQNGVKIKKEPGAMVCMVQDN